MVTANLRLVTATITVGGETYTEHIQDYEFVPSPAISEVTDVSGKVHKFAGESGYVLNLNVFQDFSTSGFALKMFDEEGTKVEFVIVDGPSTWTTEATLVAPRIGGATKQVGVSQVALPCDKPVRTASA